MYACNIINTKIISIKNYNNVGKKKVKCHLSCVMCPLSFLTCHLSPDICHLSPDTCHLSPVTFHLTTTLCSFSCCESPRNFDDWASGGLVSDRVKKNKFLWPNFSFPSHFYFRKNLSRSNKKDTQRGPTLLYCTMHSKSQNRFQNPENFPNLKIVQCKEQGHL